MKHHHNSTIHHLQKQKKIFMNVTTLESHNIYCFQWNFDIHFVTSWFLQICWTMKSRILLLISDLNFYYLYKCLQIYFRNVCLLFVSHGHWFWLYRNTEKKISSKSKTALSIQFFFSETIDSIDYYYFSSIIHTTIQVLEYFYSPCPISNLLFTQ